MSTQMRMHTTCHARVHAHTHPHAITHMHQTYRSSIRSTPTHDTCKVSAHTVQNMRHGACANSRYQHMHMHMHMCCHLHPRCPMYRDDMQPEPRCDTWHVVTRRLHAHHTCGCAASPAPRCTRRHASHAAYHQHDPIIFSERIGCVAYTHMRA